MQISFQILKTNEYILVKSVILTLSFWLLFVNFNFILLTRCVLAMLSSCLFLVESCQSFNCLSYKLPLYISEFVALCPTQGNTKL